MVRKVKDKYNLWLVGYYDDFNGARALPNDDNVPDNASVGAFSHLHTHYGNALNGEATLNPRYRWCFYDRTTVSGYPNSDEPYMFSLTTNRLLHNKGAFEWLSHDVMRNYPSEPQGRAELQYPDGHTNANKFRIHPFSGGGDDAYQMFCNGHNTLGRYIVPTGDIDSSFGRRDMASFLNTYTSKTGGKNAWVKDAEMGGSNFGVDDEITMIRRAHLAGKWMGETLKYSSGGETMPLNVFAPLESPSGMPFLCVQQYNKTGSNSAPSIPSIYYDGVLNSRDTNDILHFRLAVRSFNGGTSSNGKITPKITIKAGYTSGPAAITNGTTDMEAGLTGTAKISFDLDLTDYDTNPHLYTGNSTKVAYENDDSWIDVDVHLNYDTNKFNVYQDGNLKVANQSLNNAVAENLYGWAIFMHPLSGSDNVTSTLMLDRAALCRPLTDDPIGRDLPPVDLLKLNTTINGYSTCSFKIKDDADNYEDSNYGFSTDNYKHNFTSMFLGNRLSDWGVVFFASAGETGSMDISRIDKPLWRGRINKVDVKQEREGRTVSITAIDGLTSLEGSIPMWELGQGKTNDLETFSAYWAYDAEGLLEVMDFGSSPFKQFDGNVGRDIANDYKNRLDQRTQLRAGHPIQMYNNEDDYGPNNLEDDFEGAGVEYFYEDSTGIRFVLSGNPNIGGSGNIVIDNTGKTAYDNLTVAITAHHSIDNTGAFVTYNSTHSQEVLTVAKGSGTGQFPFVEDFTNSIAYIGKYVGPSVAWDDENYSFTGTTEQAQNYSEFTSNNPATWEMGRGSIGGLRITKRGKGYTISNNYYTLVDGVKEKKGNLVLPAPNQPDPSAYPNWVGSTATAEWESETAHINVGPGTPEADETSVTWIDGMITNTVITDGGSGYGFATNGASYSGPPDLNSIDRVQGTGSYANDGVQEPITGWDLVFATNWPSNNSHTHLNGTHIVEGHQSHGMLPYNAFKGYFDATSSHHSTSGYGAVFNIVIDANDTGGYDTLDITTVSHGSGYALNDTLYMLLPYLAYGSALTYISIKLKVTSVCGDAEFEIIEAEQAHTDTLSFHMDTRHASDLDTVRVGDEFIISGASSDYDDIRGKHTVKAIKKVLNFHGSATHASNKNRYLYQIQTFTPIPSGFTEGDFGDFNTQWGLIQSTWWGSWMSDRRVAWSKKRSATITPKPASMSEEITHRATHAVWMRDLPDSLWFKYHFGRIGYTAEHTFSLVSTVEANASSVEITQATYDTIPNAGVAEIVQAQGSVDYATRKDLRDFFIYKCKYTEGGRWFLGACKYISLSHPTTVTAWDEAGQEGAQNTQVHIIRNDNDWKHIWLLWADMRNDGTADADGGQRKKEFGLKYPTSDNYTFNIKFDDQVDENGDPQSFAQLKIGEDLDVWEIDSTIDDSTASPFSRPLDYDNMVGITGANVSSVGSKLSINKTGHGLTTSDYVGLINFGVYDGTYKVATVTDDDNFVVDVAYTSGISGSVTKLFYTKTKGSSIDETYYRDWHNTGGAFVVIDTSKFFNLNTVANRGKVGQDGGGQTNLGDYYAVGQGDPVLIDSYYRNASSTSLSTDSNYRKHYNLQKMVSNKTELAESIVEGQFWLEPTDNTKFGNHGVGRILGITYGSNMRSDWYFLWNGNIKEDVLAKSVTVSTVSAGDSFWTITKSGATFISDGVKEGAYVENTTKPLVEGVGDSWKTGWKQKFYYRVKEVVSETQLKIERVIYYVPTNNRTYTFGEEATGEDFAGLSGGLYTRPSGIDADTQADGWESGHHLRIPKQLCNLLVDTVNSGLTDNSWSPAGIETVFTQRLTEMLATKSGLGYAHATRNVDKDAFSVVEVYTSTANEYVYRLMMKINGKYKNTNGGTFYESDKMRVLWNTAILKSWWSDTKLSAMFDIQNVPISFDMTSYNTNSEVDSYGSMVSSNNKAVLDTIRKSQESAGFGDDNSLFTSFSWLMGRDNRIDFRPKYNSGYTITRDEVKVSKFKMGQMERVENVRVIYNKGMSIADYPKPTVGDTTTWLVVEHPNITSSLEAVGIAKNEYNARKKNPIALDVEMLRLHTDDTDAMLDGGRYGYIADAQVALQGNNDQSLGTAWCWTILGTGGVLFPGMVNALDGNMGSVVSEATLHSRYGKSDDPSGATIPHEDNYTWYGSRSVSKALQIVHIGKDTPKSSAATGEKLRVVIAVKPNQATTTTIDTAQFRAFLLDCSFTTNTSSGYAVDLEGDIEGHSYVDMQYNGFYEVDVPSTYGTGKVVISFNADYCRDLLRSRCGDPTATHSGLLKVLHNSTAALGMPDGGSYPVVLDSYNYSDTIFPLGCRHYSNMRGGIGNTRKLWYAPTLNIVDDVMYVPATYVKYTDAGYDINNKTMVIDNVRWEVSHDRGESVKVSLREDESSAAASVLGYIFKPVGPPQPMGHQNVNVITPTKPPTGGVSDEIKPDPPSGGYSPSDNDGWKEGNGDIGLSNIDRGAYRALKNSMDIGGSKYSAQYTNSILGQNIMPTTPSSMRGMTGSLRIHPTEGSATATKNGINLPGKGKDDGVGANAEVRHKKRETEHAGEIRVQTPSDAINDEINITGDLKLPSTAKQGAAVLYVNATCLETGATVSEAVNVSTGANFKNRQLCSTTILEGAGTTGNTIVVTLSRVAGKGSDSASYTTMCVDNVNVNFRRAAFSAENTNNIFMPFS